MSAENLFKFLRRAETRLHEEIEAFALEEMSQEALQVLPEPNVVHSRVRLSELDVDLDRYHIPHVNAWTKNFVLFTYHGEQGVSVEAVARNPSTTVNGCDW